MQHTTKILIIPRISNLEEILAEINEPLEVTSGRYDKLQFHFVENDLTITHDGVDIKTFDAVWLNSYWGTRDIAYAVSMYLQSYNIPCTFAESSTSKLTDQVLFSQGNIPVPNTFFTNNKDLLKSIEQIEATCGYPMIIKDIRGLKGNFSVFINNRSELLEQSALLPKHRKFMYQQFIPNDFDWGVLVANNEVVSAEKSYRQAGTEFRNNTFIGATEVFVDVDLIPEKIKTIALQASSQLGLSWSRSDIIVDKFTDMPYIMETNRSPGLTSGTTEVAGARNYLQDFVSDVKNRRNAEQRQLQFEQVIITNESHVLLD